ncbi:DUF4077 domain-containing protein [Paenibacillus sp.]|uniref:DUF4077 domain-containing protein n=1 Tax=Paenibacillus sp. TaxID=58172 RepID=UPI002D5F7740|nr:DUF4077 domain-containing protein [Paenibacillus sp.]HZG55372.1 DUF4077 domain-containing protein [Paenibacillus sp.]
MLAWIKERCFSNLEKESQKNNLLLFVILATYSFAECNVLLNNAFSSPSHLIFLGMSVIILGTGLVLNRVSSLVSHFKYIMMTLLLLHAITQIILFKELPAVYQVLYFNLALTLIYLDGKLTSYVGISSLLFTLIAGLLFHDPYFPYLRIETLNIPLGILAETTVVLWAATKIGTSFSLILETKERLARLLKENETQLRIIEQQNKTLETYAFQAGALAVKEERLRSEAKFKQVMAELASDLLTDLRSASDVEQRVQGTISSYANRLSRPTSIAERFDFDILKDRVIAYEETTGIRSEWKVEGEPKEISGSLGAILTRAVQDFHIYASMYRGASTLETVLSFHSEHLTLTLADDGEAVDDQGWREAIGHLSEKVKEAQGSVELASYPGKGTVLTLRLPYELQVDRKITVALVDADPFSREVMEFIFGKETDMDVIASLQTGDEAIRHCKEFAPDVVVMDIEFPETDGIELARWLKTHLRHTKVVILTRRHEVGCVAEAIAAGADAYLLKSTSPRGLAASIRHLMEGGTLLSRQTTDLLANQALRNHQLENIERRYISQAVTREYGLKEKEVEILELLAQGRKYKEIASALFLTEGTVRNYLSGIYAKLNVEDRTQATEKAIRLGIVLGNNQAG